MITRTAINAYFLALHNDSILEVAVEVLSAIIFTQILISKLISWRILLSLH